jgi:hypothetical protein
LYELNLQDSGPAEVIHQSALAAPLAGFDYSYRTAVALQSAAKGSSTTITTDYVFGSIGTQPASTRVIQPNLPEAVANKLKGLNRHLHQDSRTTLEYASPNVAGYFSSYPWPIDKWSSLTANSSLAGLASCKNSTSLVGLLATWYVISLLLPRFLYSN